jgi:glutathione S-transferase
MTKGFEALERTFAKVSGHHCVGDEITAADCCLIPQVFGALRFKVDITQFQNVRRLYENALKLEAVQLAAPERQPDFVP